MSAEMKIVKYTYYPSHSGDEIKRETLEAVLRQRHRQCYQPCWLFLGSLAFCIERIRCWMVKADHRPDCLIDADDFSLQLV
jgi:hypothetical protein